MHNRATASLLHRFRCGLRSKELSFEDGVKKPVVIFLSDIGEWFWSKDTGIFHQNIQATKVSFSSFHESGSSRRFGNVTCQKTNPIGARPYFFCRRTELCFVFSAY